MEVEQVEDVTATVVDNTDQVLTYGNGEIFYTFQPKLQPAKAYP
jgi:hypothetical protein